MEDRIQKCCLLLLRITCVSSICNLLLSFLFPQIWITTPYMVIFGFSTMFFYNVFVGVGIILFVLTLLFLVTCAIKKEKLLLPIIFSVFSLINAACGVFLMSKDAVHIWSTIGTNVYFLILFALLCRYCRNVLLCKSTALPAGTSQTRRLCFAAKVYEWATRIIVACIPIYILIVLFA